MKTMNQLMTDVFGDVLNFADNRVLNSVPYNITEFDNHYELQIIAPGYNKSQFNVEVHNPLLTVSYTDTASSQENKGKVIKQGYVAKNFKLQFNLGNTIQQDGIQAEYKDGILYLQLQKVAKTTPQKIAVSVL
jgi:HSP20 family protein